MSAQHNEGFMDMSKHKITVTASVKGNTKVYVNGNYTRTFDGDVSIVEVLETVERELNRNLQTHTGMVHAPGRFHPALRGNAPKCCSSTGALSRLHYLVPVTDGVTCKRCLTALAKER